MIVPARPALAPVADRRGPSARGSLAEKPLSARGESSRATAPPPDPEAQGQPAARQADRDVDWKDVTLLRTFISDRGKIRARRVTGLTPQQQRQVATAIRNAREMALLPYPVPGAADVGAPLRVGPVSNPLAGVCSIVRARSGGIPAAVPPL